MKHQSFARIFAIALGVLAFSPTQSNADIHVNFHNKGRHHSQCRNIMQVVKFSRGYDLKNYGKACRDHRGSWALVSKKNHPWRYGKALYYWDTGRLEKFHQPHHRSYKQSHRTRRRK